MVPLDNPKQFFAEARVPSRRSRASVAHARCLRGVKLDQVGVARRFVGNCETRQMRRVPRPGRGSGGRRLLSSPCADSWQGLGCISVKGSSRDTSLGSKTAGETLKPPPPPPPTNWPRLHLGEGFFNLQTFSAGQPSPQSPLNKTDRRAPEGRFTSVGFDSRGTNCH